MPQPVESGIPIPPRFRRLKIHATTALVLMFLLLGVRWWWAATADPRIAAMIESAHARGDKILREDYNADRLDDTENAAAVLRTAATGISLTLNQQAWENTFTSDPPLNPSDVAIMGQIIKSNRAALNEARRARAMPRTGSIVNVMRPAYMTLLAHLNPMRQLADIERYAILHEHAIGNDADAIEHALDSMRLGDATMQSGPGVICYLVGSGIQASLCDTLTEILPAIDIATPNRRAATTRPASREQIVQLIGRLLDEEQSPAAARQAWHGEQMMALDNAPAMAATTGPRWMVWALEPMFNLDALRGARRCEAIAAATAMPALPLAVASVPPAPSTTAPSRLQNMTISLSAHLARNPERSLNAYFRMQTSRRALATVLAIRLYRLDHDGALPATLDALVPTYLPAVPRDGMSARARPLSYRTAAARPCVYSVGTNGLDDGGSDRPLNRSIQRTRPLTRWETEDAMYFIGPLKARGSAPPATQTQPPPVSRAE